MLKYINLFFLFIAISLPADHSNTTLIFSIKILGIKLLFTDFLFIFFIIVSFFLKRSVNKLDLVVIGFILYSLALSVFFSLTNSYLFNQLLYDFRPILYFGLVAFKKELFDFKEITVFFTVLFGLFTYSFICFTYFIFGTDSLLIFENVNLGRIVFHNDYLLIIGLPLVLYGIKNSNFSFLIKLICFILLISFLLKLLISMGRGITFFVGLSVILYFINDFKRNKIKSFVLYLSLILILFYSYGIISKLVLGDSADIIIEYFESRYDSSTDGFQENQIDNRSTMFYTGLKEVIDSPLFGHGAGYTFKIDSKEWDGHVSFVDSSLITSLIRYGIIGTLLLYGIILFILFRNYNKNNTISFYNNSIVYIISASLILILIYTLFNSILVASYSIIVYYWLLKWVSYNRIEKKN